MLFYIQYSERSFYAFKYGMFFWKALFLSRYLYMVWDTFSNKYIFGEYYSFWMDQALEQHYK